MPTRAPRPCPVCRRACLTPCCKKPERQSEWHYLYGHKWKQARIGYLAHHPLCVTCLDNGFVVPATVVDHIIPHRGDVGLFWDFDGNIQSLCSTCHNAKSATEKLY